MKTAILALMLCVGLGLWRTWSPTSSELETAAPATPGLTIEQPNAPLGPVTVGIHVVPYRIINTSDQPHRVIGYYGGCGTRACFTNKLDGHLHIPAHGEIIFECEVTVHKAGQFDCPATLILDDGGIRSVKLTAWGTADAAETTP